jgi:DNA polymerase-4
MGATAYLCFAGFYTAVLAKKQPGQGARVVFRKKAVLDSNAAARAMGIVPGIASSEARYAARGGRVEFIDYKYEDYAEEARRWLDVCAEYTGVIEPEEPHSAYLDLQGVPAPHELAEPLAADVYAAVRLCPQIGIANSKLVARVAGRALRAGEDSGFLAQLPIERLWPVKIEYRRRLRFLGYRTIGEVAGLPSSLLCKQFGNDGLSILRWAMGIDESRVNALYPPEEVGAKFYFPQPAKNDAEVETALLRLSQDLASKLSCRDAQTRKLLIKVAFERREESANRTFNRPMRSSGALLTGLRLTLRQILVKEDVYAIAATIAHEPASDSQYSMEVDKESADASPAVDRLKETFGAGVIYSAKEVSTPRRRLLLRAYEGDF